MERDSEGRAWEVWDVFVVFVEGREAGRKVVGKEVPDTFYS